MQPESSAAQQAGAGSSGCALTPKAIDGALRGTFRRAPLPLAYQASLGPVALAVVLIPLSYVAVIGLVIWGTVWYGLDTSRMLANQPGDEANAIIRYFGPLLGGAVLVAALLKPLVAPRGQPWDSVSLRPGEEPLLDHYSERCAASWMRRCRGGSTWTCRRQRRRRWGTACGTCWRASRC